MELINTVSKEKLRGGFYTPLSIASFIIKWALNGKKDNDILEPSCGDGVFVNCLKGSSYNSITGIELDEIEYLKSKSISAKNYTILNEDFHKYCNTTSNRFDVVLGNPPYIRYQFFSREQQQEALKIFRRANLSYSKLMNAWVSFVVGSSLLLKDSGKIGFVLPAELLQVSYAHGLRIFLASFYNKINIVSFRKLVFPDIQQEVVLLLCEKNNSNMHKIEHIEIEDANELETLDVEKLRNPNKKIDFKTNKWTFYFLDQIEIDFLEELLENSTIPTIGSFANVEVGITTGANPYFTVSSDIVSKYDLQSYAKPMVGRSVQVKSLIFTSQDWKENNENGARSNILLFPLLENLKGNGKAIEYIEEGLKQKINGGYKCGIRNEWQIIPSTKLSEALFIRRNNIYPRLIINEAQAHTTDTMHRVWMKNGASMESFVASYYNSISLAFAEVCGRSHGGGVLELMPSEVESILLPYHIDNHSLVEYIDAKLRNGESIENILNYTNKIILKENYGFTNRDIILADKIREKLSTRRIKRGKPNY